jgi:putative ABC transport system permease protein
VIPVKYNLRSLRIRWVTTLLTAIFTGLLVCASVFVFGLVDGLRRAFDVSSDELKLIVLRKGATDEIGSQIDGTLGRELGVVLGAEGIATDAHGRVMSSAEMVTILTKPRRGDTIDVNLSVRGMTEAGPSLRPGFEIVEGRMFEPGKNEVITSPSIAGRFQNCGIGEELTINRRPFRVVGLFRASGSVAESEVWTALADLQDARRMGNFITTVVMQAKDEPAKQRMIQRIESDEQFNLEVKDENEYYVEQVKAVMTIRKIGYGLAMFLSIGAMFGAANTMYAAVAGRAREIGTLRALGFSRTSVLASFLFESITLCLLAGIAGCLFTLPFNGMSSGTSLAFNEVTFAFNFGPRVMLQGALLALVLGLLGGLFPAVRAVRMDIVKALREV